MKNISLILIFFCASSTPSYSMNLLIKKMTEKFGKFPTKAFHKVDGITKPTYKFGKFFSKHVDPACIILVPTISLIPALIIYDQVSGLSKDHKLVQLEETEKRNWFEKPGYYER